VFKSPDSVQLVPSNSSVNPPAGGPPPKTKPAVNIPELPEEFLAVFKSLTSV